MTFVGEIGRAIEAGLRFLLSTQSEAGHWSDWNLPPGESRMWTTAYAGYRLATVPELGQRFGDHALGSAVAWLASHEFEDGGWGYCEEVGPDADSTAYAILFLSSQRAPVQDCSYSRLLSFQREDGGYSTYAAEHSSGGWIVSQPDVTAAAIDALLTRFDQTERFVSRAMDYAMSQVTPEGLWNAYWWNTPLYSTEANLRWLGTTGRRSSPPALRDTLLCVAPRNVFETALLLSCLLHARFRTDHVKVAGSIGALLDAQLPDGSWPSAPVLRLPSRDCFQSWPAGNPSPLFADPHRIFTSATVVAALSAARRAGPAPST
jgi:squalene cyclase